MLEIVEDDAFPIYVLSQRFINSLLIHVNKMYNDRGSVATAMLHGHIGLQLICLVAQI